MWELIRINKRNSVLLLAAMGTILLMVGFAAGLLLGGPEASWVGILIAAGVWLMMMLISLSSGDRILLASSGAVPVTADVHPVLFNVVEEMTIAANLPKMPKVYIINDPSPNAFATGRNPENASVAATAGLLTKLNRDELQGVIAHEISHIVHRDILFVTLASVILGSVVLISQIMTRSMFYGSMGSRRRYSSRSNQGNAQFLIILIAVFFAILAPLFVQLLYFALSRRREYLADAGAVRLTRYPEGLASALEKIAESSKPVETANQATAPMYIANPLRGRKAFSLMSTHPPVEERIRILRNMSHGVSYMDYANSFESITHRSPEIPKTALKPEDIEIRAASPETGQPPAGDVKTEARNVGDLMRTVSGFRFATCPCGLKMKIPPEFKGNKVECPRCKRISDITS